MSKMGDWVIEIEQDKIDLTREQFVSKHGAMFAYIYDEQLGIVSNKHTRGEQHGESRTVSECRSAH